MYEPVPITKEYRDSIDRVAQTLLGKGDIESAQTLEACASLTIEGREQFSTEEIAQRIRSEIPIPSDRVRQAVYKLKAELDRYYSDAGSNDPYRFSVEHRTHLVLVRAQRVFPEPLAEDPVGAQRIDPRAFGQFLRNMCEAGPLNRNQLDRQVKLWADGSDIPINLQPDSEFQSLLTQLGNWGDRPRLSFHEMRGLCKHLEIHPIMLDPLLAEEKVEDCLGLNLGEFIVPPPAGDETYGQNALYAVQPKRQQGTDVNLVYVRLNPSGRSDIHHHPGDEIILPLEGEVEIRLHDSGMRVELRAGQMVHFHSEQTHSVLNKSDKSPAFLLILRFYQIDVNLAVQPPPSRQQMRRDLRGRFGENSSLTSAVKGWVLQSLAARGGKTGDQNETIVIRDQCGLARLIRLMEYPSEVALQDFLATQSGHQRRVRKADVRYDTLEAFLTELETRDLQLPATFLTELAHVFKNVYDLLFLRFLFPGVPGAVVFRPDDEEDYITVPPFARGLVGVPYGVTHAIPVRNLTCADLMMSRLTLKPQNGTIWNRHPGHELLIPLEGAAEIQMDRDGSGPRVQVSFEDQTIAHYRSSREHRVWNQTKHVSKLLVIRFYGDRLARVEHPANRP